MSRGSRAGSSVLDLGVLALCAFFVQGALRDLFLPPHGAPARWVGPWSTPKIADVTMIAAATSGLVTAGVLLVVRAPGIRRMARTVEILALVGLVIACVWSFDDFLSNTGKFG